MNNGEPGPSRKKLASASSTPAKRPGSKSNSPQQALKRESLSKSLQACDRCRGKKIKCMPDPDGQEACRTCVRASTACTYELPLTASRSKRVHLGLSRQTGESDSPDALPLPAPKRVIVNGGADAKSRRTSGRTASKRARDMLAPDDGIEDQWEEDSGPRVDALALLAEQAQGRKEERAVEEYDPVGPAFRLGPTSIPYIFHSAPTILLEALKGYDDAEGLSMYQNSLNEGYIRWIPPVIANQHSLGHAPVSLEQRSKYTKTYHEAYRSLLPLVTVTELEHAKSRALRLAVGYMGALHCNDDQDTCRSLRDELLKAVKEESVDLIPAIEHVQVMLLMLLTDEMNVLATNVPVMAISRRRLAIAHRMAVDLGADSPRASEQVQRIWRCLVILDQWHSARSGLIPIISTRHLVKLSRPFTHPIPLQPHHSPHPTHPAHEAFDRLFSLSVLLSRTLSLLYGPRGVKDTSNKDVLELLDDVKEWKRDLPDGLRLTSRSRTTEAGILAMLHTALNLLLHRPFMRWSFIPPARFIIDMDLETWIDIRENAIACIGWLEERSTRDTRGTETGLYGDGGRADKGSLSGLPFPFAVPYAVSLLAWTQYHTWIRRREKEGLEGLDSVEKVVQGWIKAEGSSALKKQLSPITLLHSLAHSRHSPTSSPLSASSFHAPRGLNPTPGVLNRLPETSVNGITFVVDPSHPKGGVLVVTRKAAAEIRDLPEGTVVLGEGDGGW